MAESSRTTLRNDMRTEQILEEGATVNQLAILFNIDKGSVRDRLRGKVRPNGNKKKGYELYWVYQAAPHLVPAIFDLEEFARVARKVDMPVLFTKEYWAAMRSHQLWQRDNNELWPTEQVTDVISTLLKTFRMSVLAVNEAVSREENLTPYLRELIRDHLDRVLEESYNGAKSAFAQLRVDLERRELETASAGASSFVLPESELSSDAGEDDDPNGGI